MWTATDGTVRNQHNGACLRSLAPLEVWAGPLTGESRAVVLLNRGSGSSEPITVQWADIGFPADKSATIRDLWARKNLGSFRGHFTSPYIDFQSVMMLNITLEE